VWYRATGEQAFIVAGNNIMSFITAEQQRAAASMRYPFWFGGSAASMAAVVTHPLDLGTH